MDRPHAVLSELHGGALPGVAPTPRAHPGGTGEPGMFAVAPDTGYDGCIPPGNGALVAGPTAGPDL